ncbi:flagellar motor switch protein FliM [Tepiditoga spiralis]|uniref:Flagellar motor switch protein FliM n=1 Tax=Tepiditoga spiralis TaxID=2108365 RepID=A0A7G1GC08_9BACT|nr:flagellar motor switch protein FliM [Tepiditoga spiralis]BBE32152.1 flagellar motor switch protein FliM [Tepiditoga spiralis]
MADTLSQEEIDQLLNSIGDEEQTDGESVQPIIEEKKVREYNFRRPTKFSREQSRTLQLIHENFARELSTYLSGRCRTYVEVRYASLDQITFSEFQQSLTSPTYISIFSTDVLSGNSILQIGLDVGYVIIDTLLGGPGTAIDELRAPTEIETSILRKESNVMLRSLSKSWSIIADFDISLEKVETNPQFVQIAPPNEMIVLITLSITIKDTQGFINLCFPSSTLEPISDKLSTRMWQQVFKKSEMSHKNLENLLMLSKLKLSAVLGKSKLYLNDILNLSIGDVIRLDSFYEDPIDLNVQNTPIFKVKVGTNKGFYAVKIEEENEALLEKIIIEKNIKEATNNKNNKKTDGGVENVG